MTDSPLASPPLSLPSGSDNPWRSGENAVAGDCWCWLRPLETSVADSRRWAGYPPGRRKLAALRKAPMVSARGRPRRRASGERCGGERGRVTISMAICNQNSSRKKIHQTETSMKDPNYGQEKQHQKCSVLLHKHINFYILLRLWFRANRGIILILGENAERLYGGVRVYGCRSVVCTPQTCLGGVTLQIQHLPSASPSSPTPDQTVHGVEFQAGDGTAPDGPRGGWGRSEGGKIQEGGRDRRKAKAQR